MKYVNGMLFDGRLARLRSVTAVQSYFDFQGLYVFYVFVLVFFILFSIPGMQCDMFMILIYDFYHFLIW